MPGARLGTRAIRGTAIPRESRRTAKRSHNIAQGLLTRPDLISEYQGSTAPVLTPDGPWSIMGAIV